MKGELGIAEMKRYTWDAASRKLENKDFFLMFNPAFQRYATVSNDQGAFRPFTN